MQNVNPEILQYIKEIADKMRNFRASIMVGAGFSKNADKNMPTDKTFLNWNELGDLFYEKVHGKKPDIKVKYLNVLKLAEEVESAFGRTVLNQLIKDNLPDNEYSPSELHEKLLQLNWRDIFTTNYDTLLERTQENIADKHYNIVLNKEDLIYSKEPRIIKLHGSFPSTTPFIITEEDYRQYPKESAVFVNTVQQSLIENVLCLVGFSGDDPNFLQWIGWIRDNIGKDLASKIYMVGIFNFTSAELKLLEKRNIIVLNMSICEGVNNDHRKGLNLFFDTLNDLTTSQDPEEWQVEEFIHFSSSNITIEKIQEVTRNWQMVRETYPGWYILPYKFRKNLIFSTEHCDIVYVNHCAKEINSVDFLKFLYEYNWRQNKCLIPIDKADLKIYEKVIWAINPFDGEMASNDVTIPYTKNSPEWNEISTMWVDLLLDLLRAYRENGIFNKAANAIGFFEKINLYLSKEQLAKLNCEKVKLSLFELNIQKAQDLLNNWKYDVTLPAWEMQRAGLLIELGDLSQAYRVITDELNYIRKSYTKEIDLYKISLEAYLVFLADYIKKAVRFVSRDDFKNIDIKDKIKLNENTLKRFNPYEERRLFEAFLKDRPKVKEYETEQYDLNRITRLTISSADKSHLVAFQFIRYFEEIGMVFCCNHVVASKEAAFEAIRRINSMAPIWSLVLQARLCDSKIADEVWTREDISRMSNDEIAIMVKICLEAIKTNYEYIEQGDRWRETNFQLGIAGIMPEILSRLCTRMSDEAKIDTLEILNIIYKSNNICNFRNVNHLAERLIKSMSEELKIEKFNLLLETELYIPKNEIEKRETSDIFDAISFKLSSIEKYKNISVDEGIVKKLLELLKDSSSHEMAITRLGTLYLLGMLNDEQINLFICELWSNTDENGFPILPQNRFKSYLYSLPISKDVDLNKKLKEYVLSLKIPREKNNGISIRVTDEPIFLLELLQCTYDPDTNCGIKWSKTEIDDIINEIVDAWNNDKRYLYSKSDAVLGSEKCELVKRKYQSLDDVVTTVLSSNKEYDCKNGIIKTLCEELKDCGLPYLQLYIICNKEVDTTIAFDLLCDKLCSSDISIIRNACNTIYNICKKSIEYIDTIAIIERVSLHLKMRRYQGLNDIIILIHNLIYSDVFPENNDILENILFGLEQMEYETRLSVNEFNCSTNRCISLRSNAMLLANTIYNKYNSETIRSRLSVWKSVSEDLTEFSEVRNNWIK